MLRDAVLDEDVAGVVRDLYGAVLVVDPEPRETTPFAWGIAEHDEGRGVDVRYVVEAREFLRKLRGRFRRLGAVEQRPDRSPTHGPGAARDGRTQQEAQDLGSARAWRDCLTVSFLPPDSLASNHST